MYKKEKKVAENFTPTVHIKANKDQVAPIVIMPGDPLRAKHIAENFLQDVIEINHVRNMLMYTGTYQGKRITIAGSGMGMPSIGIYSYELFKFYDVACIIRIGSMGSYQEQVSVYDIINVEKAYSESTYAKFAANINDQTISSSSDICNIIRQTAKKLDQIQNFQNDKINLKTGLIHSSDIFYRAKDDEWKTDSKIKETLGVEMEAFALFANAKYLKKSAGCILTVSDSFITRESINAAMRETNFKKMMILALESAVNYYKESKINDNFSNRN
ncbi:MAG: purine-nucleoside phosphorylase [Spiroplasma sp.]|nr:purine-nucleoside phosphorylase [Spiroplasma sp.]